MPDLPPLVSLAAASSITGTPFKALVADLAPSGHVYRVAGDADKPGPADDARTFPLWGSIYLDAAAVAAKAHDAGLYVTLADARRALDVENARLPSLPPPVVATPNASMTRVPPEALVDLLAL